MPATLAAGRLLAGPGPRRTRAPARADHGRARHLRAGVVIGTLRVAAAAVNQTPLDWDGNQRRLVELLRAAREREVGLLCLPELCIPGYGCEDAFHGPDTLDQSERVLLELLPETRGLIVCLG